MKVLLATNHTYPPQRVGGSESSIHELCLALRDCAIDVSVFSRWSLRQPGGWRYLLQTFPRPSGNLTCDEQYGYLVFRARKPVEAVSKVVQSARPNVAIINAGIPIALAEQFVVQGIPTIVYIRDAIFKNLGGRVREDPLVRYVTTSLNLAHQFEEAFGILPVSIPPIVHQEHYYIQPERKNVTFVSPVRPKGLETALQLAARRPDIPFVFVESWPLEAMARWLRNRQIRALKNVTLRESTQNMRDIYREAKIVLIPTPRFEGWSRVVSEAQISGIPVLASDIGGLPQSVGPGGLLVSPDAPIEDWEYALSRIWDDPVEYNQLAGLALQHANRPEFEPRALASRLCSVITELLGTAASL